MIFKNNNLNCFFLQLGALIGYETYLNAVHTDAGYVKSALQIARFKSLLETKHFKDFVLKPAYDGTKTITRLKAPSDGEGLLVFSDIQKCDERFMILLDLARREFLEDKTQLKYNRLKSLGLLNVSFYNKRRSSEPARMTLSEYREGEAGIELVKRNEVINE